MGGSRRGPASDFDLVVRWLAVLWACFIVDIALRVGCGFYLAEHLGLRPGRIAGLLGIFFAPFLHANFAHLLANSLGLLILGWVSCGYGRQLTAIAVSYAMVCSGLFTWIIDIWLRPGSLHIGASGVIFGLIGFLVANGLFRRGWLPVFLALITLALYAGALPAMLPPDTASARPVQQISWEMHLGGFIGGVLASWHLRRERMR